MRAAFALAVVVGLTGRIDVVGRDTEMERVAIAFSKAADDCLLDVRDRNIPYTRSYNCTTRLGQAISDYTRFPNMKLTYTDEAVPRHAYIVESAKSVAWSAAARSNAMFRNAEPGFSLW